MLNGVVDWSHKSMKAFDKIKVRFNKEISFFSFCISCVV